jgi:thioredoxin reductase
MADEGSFCTIVVAYLLNWLPCLRRQERLRCDGHLSEVELADKKAGQGRTIAAPALFSFIGAVPRADWLPPEVERDARGFVRTGAPLARSPHWSRRRQPFLLETSRAGVLAAGDVRSGSVKRVASAVGEGAKAVQFVHECLKEMWPSRAASSPTTSAAMPWRVACQPCSSKES